MDFNMLCGLILFGRKADSSEVCWKLKIGLVPACLFIFQRVGVGANCHDE